VIEAKNEREGKLPKVDAGQLQQALAWFNEVAPERKAQPVVVARRTQAEFEAFFPEGTRVITPDGLALLVENIERFLMSLSSKEPGTWTPAKIGQLLQSNKLAVDQFLATYTKPMSS
jgi:hypothetical protein